MSAWTSQWEGTTGYHGSFRIGRLQLGYHVYRHRSHLPDRWVFQPFLIYDRLRAMSNPRRGAGKPSRETTSSDA